MRSRSEDVPGALHYDKSPLEEVAATEVAETAVPAEVTATEVSTGVSGSTRISSTRVGTR